MLRLILVVVLLLSSLLCFFRPPVFYLWYGAILINEFPWIFMLLSAALTLLSWRSDQYRVITVVLGTLSFIMFSSPILRAYSAASKLDNDFNAVYGTSTPDGQKAKFGFMQMFTGLNATQLPYKTFTYSAVDGGLTLDYYASQIQGKRPCVVVVHGGSWAGGDSKQLPELNTHLAKLGYNIVSINYRLAPKHLSPAPVEDLQSVLNYLKQHGEELNIDTNNFVLLGRSAGGQIVLCAAYIFKDPSIKGVINFYGPSDMIWGYANPANPLVFNSCLVMETYLGGSYQQRPKQYAEASPVEVVTDNATPTLTIHGVIDPLVAYEHSPRLDKVLKQHHVKHYLLTFPWGTHGCDYTLNGPSGQLSTYAVDRFLKYAVGK